MIDKIAIHAQSDDNGYFTHMVQLHGESIVLNDDK